MNGGAVLALRERAVVLPGGVTLVGREAVFGAPPQPRPRVLLLHGFPEAAFVWDELLLDLARSGVAALAPNLRGYGPSSAPADPAAYKPRALVADLVALIEAEGAPLDLLVAHDWGGALAWAVAALRPDLLRRLLIINAPHPACFLRELRHSPAQQQASAYMTFLCRPDAAALLAADDFARLWPFFGNQPPWLDAARRDRYRAVWGAQGVGLEGPLNYYRGSPLRPSTGPLDALNTLVLPDAAVTVKLPTTVLWGERDQALLPGLLDGLERWVPQLDLQRVPEASHWLLHEQPARVSATIRRLLAQPLAPQP